MHLRYRNVNDAFRRLVTGFHLGSQGDDRGFDVVRKESRNGPVLVVEEPVLITYSYPTERVLLSRARDANPFFHVYESLWMLAGSRDLASVAYYNSRMAEFSDDGLTLNGAYGYRWRRAWTSRHIGSNERVDQLDVLVRHLRAFPESRRAVLQMWNVEDDLLKIDAPCPDCDGSGFHRYEDFKDGTSNYSGSAGCGRCKGNARVAGSLDTACNLSVMFSLRPLGNVGGHRDAVRLWGHSGYFLDMTVTNRSNDLIWGLLGANYVQFGMLQEYMAARLGAKVGKYHHMTNNLHVYTDPERWKPEEWLAEEPSEPGYHDGRADPPPPLVDSPGTFEHEVKEFVQRHGKDSLAGVYHEPFLAETAQPACVAWHHHKRRDYAAALAVAGRIADHWWRRACEDWLRVRADRHARTGRGKEVQGG
jgi:hypothetical protein